MKLKTCLFLLILASNEIDEGSKLWQVPSVRVYNGVKLKSSHNFSDYAQYVGEKDFLVFRSCFPYLWTAQEFWFVDKRDRPWDTLRPFVTQFNMKRGELLVAARAIMDEIMSAYRTKTSQTGGLPNITYEPRKPEDLGTMLKTTAECGSGITAYIDFCENPESMRQKAYFNEESRLPSKKPITAACAETLRQQDGYIYIYIYIYIYTIYIYVYIYMYYI